MMIIEVKPATQADYERIKWWFEQDGIASHPACVLPPVGLIVEIDGTECACAWIYTSDGACGVGFLHFVATNPQARAAHRGIALKRGMEAIGCICREMEIKVLFGTISDRRFLTTARSLGWAPGETTNHVSISWE